MGQHAQKGDARSRSLPVDRRLYILERITSQGSVHLQDLAEELGTSLMTVRRDIKQLEAEGYLRRSHGGATAHTFIDAELGADGYGWRHMAEKRAIAHHAAQLIAPRDVLFLGSGTTVAQLARLIPVNQNITVVTYSLPIASLLAAKPGVKVVSTGGTIDSNDLSQVGPLAESTLLRYFATRAFIGAGGIHAEAGITDMSEAETPLNRIMIERAEHCYVLADHSKLGARAFAQVCSLQQIEALVTDADADESLTEPLRSQGLTVLTAPRFSPQASEELS